MSKVGRKAIDCSNVQITINGQDVHYKGSNDSGVYHLPDQLIAKLEDHKLYLEPNQKTTKIRPREMNRIWGLHRALLANKIAGSKKEFEKEVVIVGLGYKGVATGNKIVFSLGYSHKIDFVVPKSVTVTIDKTGQKLLVKSKDAQLLGQVCRNICGLRKPEPYKGTGVRLATDVIVRKDAKGK